MKFELKGSLMIPLQLSKDSKTKEKDRFPELLKWGTYDVSRIVIYMNNTITSCMILQSVEASLVTKFSVLIIHNCHFSFCFAVFCQEVQAENVTVVEGGTAEITCKLHQYDGSIVVIQNPSRQTLFFNGTRGECCLGVPVSHITIHVSDTYFPFLVW